MHSDASFLIIFLIVIVIILLRKELRENKIVKYSYYYSKIFYLNLSSELNYELNYINKQLQFKKSYKSKSAVSKANLDSAGIQYISENLKSVESLISEYNRCEKLYIDYFNKTWDILNTNFDYTNIKLNKFLFPSTDNFKKLESKMIDKIIFKDKNKLSLYVYVYYTSPKGKNHWFKDYEYSCREIANLLNTIKQHEEYMKSAKYQRSILTDSLRYDVFKRDNFTCQICGASFKEDGAKLEVDHIIPISKGGKTEMKNLQTLCIRCNRGKSDKY